MSQDVVILPNAASAYGETESARDVRASPDGGHGSGPILPTKNILPKGSSKVSVFNSSHGGRLVGYSALVPLQLGQRRLNQINKC